MSKTSKPGIVMMIVATLIACLPTLYYSYPVRVPLSNSLPLTAGAEARQTFTIRGAETYFVFLQCRGTGEFHEKWKDFLNWNEHLTIPCNITLQVLRNGRPIISEHLDQLAPASQSGDRYNWYMAHALLSFRGGYELRLTNGTDLTYLASAMPTVQVCLSSRFIKDWGMNALLGRAVGGVVFLVGLAVFLSGILVGRQPANPTASVDALPPASLRDVGQ